MSETNNVGRNEAVQARQLEYGPKKKEENIILAKKFDSPREKQIVVSCLLLWRHCDESCYCERSKQQNSN